MHFARRHYRPAPCSDDAIGAEDPSLRLAQAVRRALAQGPERAEYSLGVMNATWISGLAAAGLQKMRPAWAPAGAGWAMR
ncbi:MAG TPA: hypothetical protein PLE37_12815 [Pseudomonadota bacterium]|nr:hypothetical protein [Pseudomonadota bacterium]